MNTPRKTGRFDLKLTPENRLERHVAKWMRAQARDSYDNEIRGVVRDVLHGGCASGTVGHLIYTRDCVRFLRAHKAQILTMLQDMMDDAGVTSPADVFWGKWDGNDHFALGDANQTLLAHFGFEESVRTLASRAGYDL